MTASVIFLLFIVISTGLGVEAFAQPPDQAITEIEPKRLAPGAVAKIHGGPFFHLGNGRGSAVYFGDNPANTYFITESTLLFLVPIDTPCGNQSISVKTMIMRHNKLQSSDSNSVTSEVICAPDRIPRPVRPQISKVTPELDVRATTSISLTGVNIMPQWDRIYGISTDQVLYPYSDVIVKFEGLEFGGHARYVEPAGLTFALPEEIPCGPIDIHVRNYFAAENYVESDPYQISVEEECIGSLISRASPRFRVIDIELPDKVQVAATFSGAVYIEQDGGAVSDEVMKIFLNSELIETRPLQKITDRRVRYPLQFSFAQPGFYSIEVRVQRSMRSVEIEAVMQMETREPPAEVAPPPFREGKLHEFDDNANCRLNDGEFFDLVDRWISGEIAESLFFEAIDAWIGQTDICAANGAGLALELNMTPRGLLLSAGGHLESLSIFNSSGKRVFIHSSSSPRVFWNLRDGRGTPVANGVYFIMVEGFDEPKKLVVVR